MFLENIFYCFKDNLMKISNKIAPIKEDIPKLNRIHIVLNFNYLQYMVSEIAFTWLNPIKDKNKLVQLSDWHLCRETFCRELCRFFRRNGEDWKYPTKLKLNKLRIAVIFPIFEDDDIRKNYLWATKCKKILNVFEKAQGWKLTKVLKHDEYVASGSVFAFIGPPEWLQAPQLMSLYLLIIRLYKISSCFDIFREMKDLPLVAYRVRKIYYTKKASYNADISRFLRTYKYWGAILNNHKELFFKDTIKNNYILSSGTCGIESLINETGSSNVRMMEVWQKIYKKVK